MTLKMHSTDGLPASARAGHWNAVIAEAYFPLDLTFRDPARFEGRLQRGSVGDVSLSRLQTEPLQYERHRHHISGAREEQYLITIPRRSPVEFRQLGREVRCDPGGFLLERGDEPYRFSYQAPNDLCVLKVAKPVLAARLRNPDRYCARVFDGRSGIGSLFATMAEQIQRQGAPDEASGAVLGRHLVELLALVLDRTADTEPGAGSAVREAHRRRAEAVVRKDLANPDLSPETIAEAVGISKRYLHELFAEVNCTVSQFVREERLRAAREVLQMPNAGQMSDIAYRFGFADQAQFSRLFKAMFGQTPSGFRAQVLARGAGG